MRRRLFSILGLSGVLLLPLGMGCDGSSGSSSGTGGGGAAGAGGQSPTGGDGGAGGQTGTGTGGGATGPGGAGGGGGGGGAPVPAWDWTGIVGTGQSLAVGDQGRPVRGTEQRFDNLKLSLGNTSVPPFDPASAALSLVPLVEPIRPFATTYPSAYPNNIQGETPHTAMADQISTLAQAAGGEHVSVHTEVGESGQGIEALRKGATEVVQGATSVGRAYAATLFEVEAIARLAREADKTYGVGAIVVTHGEHDAGRPTYEDDLFKLWSDYNQDLKALTGQTRSIPMLVSQQHSVPFEAGSRSASTYAQWHVGVEHPGDIVCSGPKYQYPYADDHVHLNANGYELLGEKYGQIVFEKVVLGRDWQPLQPTDVERSGRVITVRFHVPVGPLKWDDALPSPHQTAYTEWAQGRGFEVWSGTSRITISGVEIDGDAVRITVAADLPASGVMVGYAATSDGAMMNGGTTRWGQLRDSDPFVGSRSGVAQPNYCVAFELSVP
ncbi:dockerin [Sorangium cellulosum]|uniref:Dockerin n=1 Tax=Sorangium cellulosum TaxID=56 RepID=A0A2L0ES78_SORCE|nr:dockerin [Sorangium cellulosum]AUX42153.1 dockerin [Sorangium cellulosum]